MFWQNLYNIIFYSTGFPKIFGAFHIASIIVVILATVFATYKLKDASEQTFRKFLLIIWIVLWVGEIYREVCFSLSLSGGEFVWDYAWFIFPFQLCSSPLYALPFVIFLKESKLRDGFLCFLSLWSFFGGASVMIYAGDVFLNVLGVSIQAMVHHGAQVLIGVLIAVRNGKKMNLKYFLGGLYVYLGFLGTAMLLNVAVYHIFAAKGITDTFNMFFISPYFPCTLPVLSQIHAATSWGVVFPIYVLGFVLVAFIIYLAQKWLVTRFGKNENNS